MMGVRIPRTTVPTVLDIRVLHFSFPSAHFDKNRLPLYTCLLYTSIKLCAWLCKEYGLDETDLIRHYDVTGKLCPLYYVQNPEAWDQLKTDVGESLAELKKRK